MLQEALIVEGMVPKMVEYLEDDDSDVRSAAFTAMLEFSTHEAYQNAIKLSISAIISQMDNTNWNIRETTVQVSVKLAESKVFRETLDFEGIIPRLVARLEDDDADVRTAAAVTLRVFSSDTYDVYHPKINSAIPTIIAQLDHRKWAIRREAVRMLTTLSEQETMKMDGVVEKLMAKLEDNNEDVRVEVIKALSALGTQSYFKETLNAEHAVSNIFGRLSDSYDNVRFTAIQALSTLSSHEIYNKDIKSLISISSIIRKLGDESWSTRQQAIQILAQFATNVECQAAMNTDKVVSGLGNMLMNDRDEDVRATAAQALSVFGAQEAFQNTLKEEKVILNLAGKLSDPFVSVRNAAQSTILDLSRKAFYQKDIKATIPTIMKQFEDDNWAARQQAIQILESLSERFVFQETMKTEMSVGKLVGKLEDTDEHVRAASAKALSTLGTKGPFQDRMKSERVIPKLVGKLTDENEGVRLAVYNAVMQFGKQEDKTEFLKTVISTLYTIDKPARMKVYKLLNALKSMTDTVVVQIDTVICKLLTQMPTKDLPFMFRTIAILAETVDEDLRGDDLKEPTITNKLARDAVNNIIQSKLIYDKISPDQNIVLALAQLAKHNVFVGCMKPAIPGSAVAVRSSDGSIRNAAIEAVSALAKQAEFRLDLIPIIQILIQRLRLWKEKDQDEYPLNIIEVMSSLVPFKEFRAKFKSAVPILMDQLPQSSKVTQANDTNEVAFYKATCKLISDFCEIEAAGRDLIPQLTRVLVNMDLSLTEDLLHLFKMLIKFGRLTMNDRIALASSLRISESFLKQDAFNVLVCKLNMAALLDEAHNIDHPLSEYSFFLGAVFGNGNDTVKSKLYTLVQPVVRDSKSEMNM